MEGGACGILNGTVDAPAQPYSLSQLQLWELHGCTLPRSPAAPLAPQPRTCGPHLLNQRTSSISSSWGVGCCSRKPWTASATSAALQQPQHQQHTLSRTLNLDWIPQPGRRCWQQDTICNSSHHQGQPLPSVVHPCSAWLGLRTHLSPVSIIAMRPWCDSHSIAPPAAAAPAVPAAAPALAAAAASA